MTQDESVMRLLEDLIERAMEAELSEHIGAQRCQRTDARRA